MTKKQDNNSPLKVISLFSGCGGMDLGFIQAGFEIVYANDIFQDAINTYKKNIGEHIKNKNIMEVKSKELPQDVDVVIGGFPCQGFSIANKNRNTKDERNFLYLEMLRIIKDIQPKFFVAENVKGILSLDKGKVFEMIINDFSSLGYSVSYQLLNSANYGVPQSRERVIIIGNRIGVENTFPPLTHNIKGENLLKKTPTVKDTIDFLYNVPLSKNPIELDNQNVKVVYNHIANTNVKDKCFMRKYDIEQKTIALYLKEQLKKNKLSQKQLIKILGEDYKYLVGHWLRYDKSGSIPIVEDWWKLKEILNFDDTYDKEVTTFIEKDITFEQSLRISNWDTPSDTITATSPEIHPNKKRRLSVRECAMLQTFPNDFVFYGSINNMYKQIGNAVPVLLANKIAIEIKKKLT